MDEQTEYEFWVDPRPRRRRRNPLLVRTGAVIAGTLVLVPLGAGLDHGGGDGLAAGEDPAPAMSTTEAPTSATSRDAAAPRNARLGGTDRATTRRPGTVPPTVAAGTGTVPPTIAAGTGTLPVVVAPTPSRTAQSAAVASRSTRPGAGTRSTRQPAPARTASAATAGATKATPAPRPTATPAPQPAPTPSPRPTPPATHATPAPPIANQGWSPTQVESLIRATWPADQVDKALYVARRESHLDPRAFNGWCCYGLFQIYFEVNRSLLAGYGVTSAQQLLDPVVNVRAAFGMWQRLGWGPWGG